MPINEMISIRASESGSVIAGGSGALSRVPTYGLSAAEN